MAQSENTTRPQLSSLFFDNNRLLVLMIALIAVAGLSSYYVLPRMEDPVLSQRAAIINTQFPGASAERVEALITEKLETELQEIEEVKELRSSSASGISTITIELKDSVYAVDEVWSRVRDKIDDATPLLPIGASDPDFDLLEVTAYASIVALVWDLSEEPSYAILRRQAEALEDQLRAINGTREVDTFGDPQEEIVVEIRQDELATLGLTVNQVAQLISASDAKVSAGLLRSEDRNLVLEVDAEIDSVERVRSLPIALGGQSAGNQSSGRFVALGDIAEVSKAFAQPQRSLAIVDGKPAVALGTLVKAERRVDHWTDSLQETLADFESQLPSGVRLKVLFEQNQYVETRLATLLGNLLIGATAVILVVWFMMGWRSALVVGAALPLASLMVLAGMRLMGLPMHQMSITGLIIALGLLIDNAIVMVDEVRERITSGEQPRHAVSASVKHLAVPLLGSTVTTALSFAPIALMPGPAGEFVGSIATSVILAVFSSFLLAMTVTPSLIALMSGTVDTTTEEPKSHRHWWSSGFSNKWLTNWYCRFLHGVFHRPLIGIALGVALPIAGFISASTLTDQFFPPADRNQFQIQLTLPSQSSIGYTKKTALAARDMLLEHPRVLDIEWFVGESAPPFYYNMLYDRKGIAQYAQALVQADSPRDVGALIHSLQAELDAAFPEARFLVRQLAQGPPFGAPIEMRLYGPDLEVLRELGDQVRTVLSQTPEVMHTSASLAEALPKLAINIDEEQARLVGLDNAAIARQLDASLEGATGGSLLEATEELPVRVRMSNANRGRMSTVGSLDLLATPSQPSPNGQSGSAARIPLSTIATIDLKPEVSVVPHINTQRMNEVKAYLTAEVLPAGVLADFQQRLEASEFRLPPGYRYEYGGEASKRDDAIGNLLSSVGVLGVMMVATLVLSFGSFRMAGIVGTVAFLSVGLSLGALALFRFPFGFMGIVGTMGLIGVAINDTIVVLAALREDEQARTGDPAAVRDVVLRATRHVLSTTLTTVAGFLPLIISGGGFWPPLATTIAGGVSGATIMALLFAPSLYVLLMCKGCQEKEPASIRQTRMEFVPALG
ncbi:efflux RND transporter permease subunit [Adhaeretor mobilis]|uniref:Cobalt-zinc-cadmium resistance protein CzcA n=1 Tax=Adhaeretor mobilis TaxID=1930276 RepID=A0A517MR58_9BACT|nr:efflux RND transporter permease subunit [Adhaeretor mobilis]QDS97364.1 Cobalt-zinc-cadmium resistance protein CzcA [Adhaeretor mobilis]